MSRPLTSTSAGRFANVIRTSARVESRTWIRVRYEGRGSSILVIGTSLNEHRVAVAEKAVVLPNGSFIRSFQQCHARERSREQEQRRFRKMEIRDKRVGGSKLV